MKKLIAALILISALAVQAQTNPPITVQSFAVSFEQYMTSFNTNYSFTNVTIEVATGYKQVTGVGAASTLDAQYDFGNINAGLGLQFSGVGSPINAAEAQFGYAIVNHYDTKVDIDLRAGYDWTRRAGVVEPTRHLHNQLIVGRQYPVQNRVERCPRLWLFRSYGVLDVDRRVVRAPVAARGTIRPAIVEGQENPRSASRWRECAG